MALRQLLLFCLVGALAFGVAIKKEESEPHDKRTKEHELSDLPHDVDGDHNADYDHEAFLGKEAADEFDELSPDESRKKLALVFTGFIIYMMLFIIILYFRIYMYFYFVRVNCDPQFQPATALSHSRSLAHDYL